MPNKTNHKKCKKRKRLEGLQQNATQLLTELELHTNTGDKDSYWRTLDELSQVTQTIRKLKRELHSK